MKKRLLVLGLLGVGWGTPAWAEDFIYVCTVEAETAISSIHLENAPPPSVEAVEDMDYKFWIKITQDTSHKVPYYTISEIENKGSGLRRLEVCGKPYETVLFGDYVGDGSRFTAKEDQGFFFLFGGNNFKSKFTYYHSGFEYLGCEDRKLISRYGICEPLKG